MHVPEDAPSPCPVCGADYDSVSAHDAGVMVNLLDNERYRRVCFDPVDGDGNGDGGALLYFYHHTHERAGAVRSDVAVDATAADGP